MSWYIKNLQFESPTQIKKSQDFSVKASKG